MSFSRRQFLQASGLAVCLGSLSSSVRAGSVSDRKLPIPPLLESRNGQPLFVTLQKCIGPLMAHKKQKSGALMAQCRVRQSK